MCVCVSIINAIRNLPGLQRNITCLFLFVVVVVFILYHSQITNATSQSNLEHARSMDTESQGEGVGFSGCFCDKGRFSSAVVGTLISSSGKAATKTLTFCAPRGRPRRAHRALLLPAHTCVLLFEHKRHPDRPSTVADGPQSTARSWKH